MRKPKVMKWNQLLGCLKTESERSDVFYGYTRTKVHPETFYIFKGKVSMFQVSFWQDTAIIYILKTQQFYLNDFIVNLIVKLRFLSGDIPPINLYDCVFKIWQQLAILVVKSKLNKVVVTMKINHLKFCQFFSQYK